MDMSRSIMDREFSGRRLVKLSQRVQLVPALPAALDAPPTMGNSCHDWIDAARMAAEDCLKSTNISQRDRGQGCATDANGHVMRGPCGSLLRDVSLGGSNATPIIAGVANQVIISIEANFKPMMLQIDPQQLVGNGGARATEVKYGPTSKLINNMVLLAQFDVTALTGGYRLPHDIFLTAGQTIKLTIFLPAGAAGFAADTLVVNCFGFTDAP